MDERHRELLRQLHVIPAKAEKIMRSITSEYLNDTTLKGYHMHYIFCLGRSEGISQMELSRIVREDKSRVSVVVKELQERGMVEDRSSKKTAELYLTEKGRETYAMSRMFFEIFVGKITSNLTPEELETLINLLKKISENCDSLLDDDSP